MTHDKEEADELRREIADLQTKILELEDLCVAQRNERCRMQAIAAAAIAYCGGQVIVDRILLSDIAADLRSGSHKYTVDTWTDFDAGIVRLKAGVPASEFAIQGMEL